MSTDTWFDGSYPPSILPTPTVAPTGVTAGAPGSLQPTGATIPTSLADLRADPVVGNGGTDKPGAAWAPGQYVVLDNPSHTTAFWDGTGWQSGKVPTPPPAPTTGAAEGGDG